MAARKLAALVGVWLLASGAAAAPAASALFAAAARPAGDAPAVHGAHAAGCLAGAEALAQSGPGWRLARPGRNRHWGHPAAIAFVERLASRALAAGWPGLAVGDIAQPRGGPMPSGHRSHQTGLDIDIWFRPLGPDGAVRGARTVVAADGRAVRRHWRSGHAALLGEAARAPGVDRIFVHPAIKARLCRVAGAEDRGWLRRIRPWWGHDAHFHVRLACPAGEAGCTGQAPLPPGDGCDETLAWWFTEEARAPAAPARPRAALSLADLPRACAGLVAR